MYKKGNVQSLKDFLVFLSLNSLMLSFQVARNIDLVYGGGSVGLMGLVSQAVHNGGRHVIGYVTR
jgi:hypothetical protein